MLQKWIAIGLLFCSAASASPRDVVVGKNWVTTVRNGNAILEVFQDFSEADKIKVEVKCRFPDGLAVARTEAPAEVTDTQIINRVAATNKVYSPSGANWCMAVVARRTLTYRVIDENQIEISGDPFLADGTVLKAVTP